tara:strand:+ start:19 stop:456 length:438 start_codon:yes stop_codon:yes gene_type:complete
MPTYDYLCEKCGLLFEKSVSFSNREDLQSCTSCGTLSVPQITKDISFSFNPNINSPKPPNTGISGYDHKVDRAIGKSAEFGWSTQEKRAEVKRQLLRENPNSEYGNISRNPDNTYRVMGSNETTEVDRRNKKAIPFIRKKGRKLG